MNILIASVAFVAGCFTGLIFSCLIVAAGNDRRE